MGRARTATGPATNNTAVLISTQPLLILTAQSTNRNGNNRESHKDTKKFLHYNVKSQTSPEAISQELVTRTPPPNKATHSGFETHRRRHQMSKKEYQWPLRRLMSSKIFF